MEGFRTVAGRVVLRPAVLVVMALGALLLSPPGPARAQVYYPDCAAAAAAGVTDILRWQPGWRPNLTNGNDGIACRSGRGPESSTFVPEPPAPPLPPPAELPAGTVPAALVLIVLGAGLTVAVQRRLDAKR